MLWSMAFVNWMMSASRDAHGFAQPILGLDCELSVVVDADQRADADRVGLFLISVVARNPPWAMAVCTAVLYIALCAAQPAIMSTLHEDVPPDRQGGVRALRSIEIRLPIAAIPLLLCVVRTVVGAATLFSFVGGPVSVGSWHARDFGRH